MSASPDARPARRPTEELMFKPFSLHNIPAKNLAIVSSYSRLRLGFLLLTLPGIGFVVWSIVTTILNYRETGITSERFTYLCFGLLLILPGFAGAYFYS